MSVDNIQLCRPKSFFPPLIVLQLSAGVVFIYQILVKPEYNNK